MRVQFLLGPAGSGKTFRCLAAIRERLLAEPDGPPLILLAPRQATYQLELALLSGPELAGYTRLQIVSFERFALWLLDELNVRPREMLSEEGRIMVLRALLHQQRDRLKSFGASGGTPGFARRLSVQLHELQQRRIRPEVLLRAAAGPTATAGAASAVAGGAEIARRRRGKPAPADDAQLELALGTAPPAATFAEPAPASPVPLPAGLAGKLHDVALLFEGYETWLREHDLRDAGSLLEQATEALRTAAADHSRTGGILEALWLDGLTELTPQELELLAALIPHCAEATLAFCLESEPRDELPWLSTWSVISQTFRRCHARFAAEERCAVQVEVLARDSSRSRFAGAGDGLAPLQHLEAHWTAPAEFRAPTGDALRLVACADPEQEAVLAARTIQHYVAAGNRYRDCAVLLRRLDSHHAALRRQFTRYGIPFFLDRREAVTHHPLAEFTRSALRTVLYHWRLTDWFAALKTGLTALRADEADQLENVALARGWEGGKWLRPLELADDPALEFQCEQLRQRIIGPFEQLRDSISGEPTGRSLAEALRKFWQQNSVAARLEEWSIAQADDRTHLTVYEELGHWLDNLEHAFAGVRLPLRDWLPILESGLNALSIGVIPPAIDQVLIGAVDRSRNPDLKLALVLGLNEGVFPAPPEPPALLTDSDRMALQTARLNLRDDPRRRLGHERYLGYIACTRARERLVLCWSERDADGRVLNVSPLVDRVRQIFPSQVVEHFDRDDPLEAVHLDDVLASRLRAPAVTDGETAPLELALPDEPAAAVRAWHEHFVRCEQSWQQDRLSSESVRQLFGTRLQSSASRLEQFAACPFQYFAGASLRARDRDRFEVDARKSGTFLHEVLRRFHEEVSQSGRRWRDVAPDEARREIARIADEQATRVAAGVLRSHPRHLFKALEMTRWLQEFVALSIDWMRRANAFDPVAVELRIGGERSELPEWEIDLGEGRVLAFRGSVDRVDVAAPPHQPDVCCVAVMDYKSGNKQFEPAKVRAGLQLQLPAYLAALCEVANHSALFAGRQATPAGMFYVRLQAAPERLQVRDDGAVEGPAARRFEHTGRLSFERLALFDRIAGDGGSGQFRYRLKQDGEPHAKSSLLLRQPDLDALLRDTRSLLHAMGRAIFSGKITVDPYRHGTELPCTWCDFKPVCRIDPWDHNYRPLRPVPGPVDRESPPPA